MHNHRTVKTSKRDGRIGLLTLAHASHLYIDTNAANNGRRFRLFIINVALKHTNTN